MKKTLFIFACSAVLFSACTEQLADGLDSQDLNVTFGSSIAGETRVTSNSFDSGDEIYVSAFDGASLYAEKVSYIYSENIFSSSTPIAYESTTQELSFMAAYPTVEEFGETFSFEVYTDQSVDDNYEMSDLLVSVMDATHDLSPTLAFNHVMSSIIINFTDTSLAGGVMTLHAVGGIEADLDAETYTATGSVEDITMALSGTTYKVIFAPQSISAGDVLATYEVNGKSYEWVVGSDWSFTSGNCYSYSWDIVEEAVVVTYNGNINDWEENEIDDSPFVFQTSEAISSIPEPTEGKRWVINEIFSDEFNGTELDSSKWYDYHPNWVGREPGIFKPANVAIEDGYMVLHGEMMEEEEVVWNWNNTSSTTYYISCAAVVSVTQEASHGYYECRFKANQTTLSSTFWFSTRGSSFDVEGRQPSTVGSGTFSQELDVCECIGRGGDFSGSYFADGMNSNVHFWYTPTGGDKADITIPSVSLTNPDGSTPADGFNTYGCWWRDESSVSFYLNNEQETSYEFYGHENWADPYDIEFKFTEPMGLNMVVETYPYPWIELPNEEELADETKNRTYYDWVRSYILVDADEEYDIAVHSEIFENHIHFSDDKDAVVAATEDGIEVLLCYTAKENGIIKFNIYDSYGELYDTVTKSAYSGYANTKYTLDVDFTEGLMYHVEAELMSADGSVSYEGDSFNFVY